jgi:hypothetical protein
MSQNDRLIDDVRIQPRNGSHFVPCGDGLWLSALNAIYRDVRYVVPFVQFWMFASPVAYPIWPVPVKWWPLYGLSPMAGVIEGFRWSLTGTGDPPNQMLLMSAVAVVAVLVAGMMVFSEDGNENRRCGVKTTRRRVPGVIKYGMAA